jgi:hypothetical protein
MCDSNKILILYSSLRKAVLNCYDSDSEYCTSHFQVYFYTMAIRVDDVLFVVLYHDVQINSKLRRGSLYTALVANNALWGCDSWAMTKKHYRALDTHCVRRTLYHCCQELNKVEALSCNFPNQGYEDHVVLNM